MQTETSPLHTVQITCVVTFHYARLTEFRVSSDNLITIPMLLKHLMPADESLKITVTLYCFLHVCL